MFLLDLALKFWKPLAGVVLCIAIALALGAMKRSYDDGKREEGAAPIRAEFKAYKDAAMARTTAITLAWDQKRIEAEQAGKVADDERARRIAESKVRLAALPAAVAAAPVDARAVSLLNDAIAGQQPAPAGPAAEPEPATAAVAQGADQQREQMHPLGDRPGDGLHDNGTTVGLLTGWALEAIRLYDQCREQVIGWQAFYRGLQAAQGAEP